MKSLRRCVPFLIALLMLATAVRDARSAPPVAGEFVYEHAAVAADHPVASQAGLEMLKRGGNAVDAAVATSFCLSVVRPYSCGLGGGGFMIIAIPASDGAPATHVALNYRETAPAAVGPDYFVNLDIPAAGRYGHHAAGIPGTVAGLLHALEHYGTLDRATVLAPAIRAAERGFPADANHVFVVTELRDKFEAHPEHRSSASYLWTQLCHDGAIEVGDTITNPQQARAMRLIADGGVDAFYRGAIAQAIVETMREHGGPITSNDLAGYSIRVGEPLRGSFIGYGILSMPPPSSGGVAMQQVFRILERRMAGIVIRRRTDPAFLHLLTEAFKHAFADRAKWLADPAFVDVPIDRLLSDSYLDTLAGRVDMSRTLDPLAYGSVAPAQIDGGTSHLSVIDADGMAVACTETINLSYGSLVVVPGFGFALNDQMDDFTTIPGQPNAFGLVQSDRNLPAPGKRPLSSMSPTIVLRDGRPVMIAGASGGPRIITGTQQCLLNALLFGLPPNDAVGAPRLHHQWMPDVLQFEERWRDKSLIEAMAARGHEVGTRENVGVVQFIAVGDDGLIRAASDPRKGGRPAGY